MTENNLQENKTYIFKEKYTSYPTIMKVKVLEATETTYYLHNLDGDVKFRYGKDIFEKYEITEEVLKIKVDSLQLHDRYKGNGSDSFWYQVATSKRIDLVKYKSKIEQAIESALNDTVEDSKIKELESLLEYYQAEFNANQDKVYTQAEVDAIRADTWYAARKITDKVVGEIDFKDGDRCPFYEKYFNSINDYLSSLNLNSNHQISSLLNYQNL